MVRLTPTDILLRAPANYRFESAEVTYTVSYAQDGCLLSNLRVEAPDAYGLNRVITLAREGEPLADGKPPWVCSVYCGSLWESRPALRDSEGRALLSRVLGICGSNPGLLFNEDCPRNRGFVSLVDYFYKQPGTLRGFFREIILR